MAQSSHCYLPRFTTTVDGPKRPISMKTKSSASQNAQLLTAWHEGRLKSVLQATWALVLHYYLRTEDISFGYQHIDGDSSPSRNLVQQSTATPISTIRLAIDENDTINRVVDKVRKEDESNAQIAGGIVEASDGFLPYNTILMLRTYQKTSDPSFSQPMLAIALPDQCQVRLHVKVLRRDINIFLEWRNGDMSGEQMKSVSNIFENILTKVLSAENPAITQLNLFSENDWQRIQKWNSHTPKLYDRCIHEAIHDQAVSGPDREAICAWDGSLTYGELDKLASKLACHLRMQGVGPEVRVGLLFDKSKWNVVAMLAVMKAGGAFVPLDPTHPTSRLQRLIESVKATVALCSENRADVLRPIVKTLIPLCSETMDRLADPAAGVDLASGVTSQNAAYILFTSGSTGEPKGTLLEHRAFLSGAMVHGPGLLIFRDSRCLHFAAHTFDASLSESITPLIHGACVCIPSEETRLNDIVGFINKMRVTQACFTPSFIGFIDIESVPTLESLVLAGEAMSQSQLAVWSKIKLINGYGPTEASVASVLNTGVTPETDCKDIGLPIGVRIWVVDPENHDELVPVGCPGELLLEGPTLARCYVNNPEKTNESFIYDPAWTKMDRRGITNRRFYKTGDLVRYNSDSGSLNYVGRKDTQVKVHGQRIELGEIENQLIRDSLVTHCSVLFPKAGFSKGRLAAVISFAGLLAEESQTELEPLRLIPASRKAEFIPTIREQISARLPTYMVPAVWFCVESLPMLPSGKLDRKGIATWVTSMESDPDIGKIISSPSLRVEAYQASNQTEEALVAVYSRVLNLPESLVNLNESFLALGGDSIAAMTCIGLCKKRGIGLSVQDVLRSSSIRDLATRAKAIDHGTTYQESIDEPFNLSPIQVLHFGLRKEGQGHFNQGILTRLNKPLDEKTLRKGIDKLVSRHSMLRSRFDNSGNATASTQRITRNVQGSYRWRMHTVNNMEEIKPLVAESQSCINCFSGPLLAVDYFCMEDSNESHVLSMTAHHLVVDIVSWKIILEDLEDLVLNPNTSASDAGSLPFQTWCRLQEEHSKSLLTERKAPTKPLPAIDFGYWGLQNSETTYGDVDCASFEIDEAHTQSILLECHKALETEPIDIFLASMLHSFGQSFNDRSLPVIYNEGHGREVWDPSIDISHTVGWFTILHPIFVNGYTADNAMNTLIQVKDLRRQVSDNGRSDFASRVLKIAGQDCGDYPHPFEMSFNYVGQHRDLQRKDGLFQLVDQMAGEAGQGSDAADFGRDTPRFGLFEISAMVVAGKIRFTFSFNKFMQHQDSIHNWVSNCQKQLVAMSDQLSTMAPRLTLSSFPMLSLDYTSLDKLLTQKLPALGISSPRIVEDIYPCSRMQQGILLGQSRDSSFYAVHDTFEIHGSGSTAPNVDRLVEAWKQVVSHHAMFRTIFVENLTPRDPFCQVVLKEYDATPVFLQSAGDSDVLATFDAQEPKSYKDKTPAYRFTICQTSTERLFCRIELSHAAMDGNSISIILRDLQLAYVGRLEETRRPLFKDYIRFLQDAPQTASMNYWSSYLSDAKPCVFPTLRDGEMGQEKSLRSIPVNFVSLTQLQSACEKRGITLSNVFNAAWGLTLRLFCGSDDVSFSYMASLRDVTVDGIQTVVGPVINLMICRMKLSSDSRLSDVLKQIQDDYMESLPFRHTSLIDIQHALKLSDVNLFNSGVSYRRLPGVKDAISSDIECVEVGSIHDPAEFPVFINIEAMDTKARIDLNYWTTTLSDAQALNVANTYVKCLETIMTRTDSPLRELDLVNEQNKSDILTWNGKMPQAIQKCAHKVVQEIAAKKPDGLAVTSWDGSLTYSKLDQYSSRLASYLITFGVGPGSLIPTSFNKSVWNIVSMLAIMKAGGGCIPVDSPQTMTLIKKWVVDNSVQVALASPERAQVLEESIPYVVPVSESLLEYLNDEPLASAASPSDAAYVAFTSGTSQASRAVILEHSSIMTRAEAFASSVKITDVSRVLQFAAHTSDSFLLEVFGAFVHGACVCIPADAHPTTLATSIETLHANVACLTPTVASFINPKDVPGLKTLAMFGEITTQGKIETWQVEDLQLHNLYGTAETSSASFQIPMLPGLESTMIGAAVSSVSWVVDPSNCHTLVPVGAVGELVLEGPVLGANYLGQEQSESFFQNPSWLAKMDGHSDVNALQSRKFFKTGDLVRYNADGSLVYVGPKNTDRDYAPCADRLLVEECINNFFRYGRRCIVQSLPLDGESRTVVFVCAPESTIAASGDRVIQTSAPELKATISALHIHLCTKISSGKIPSLYIPISAIPLTPFGKTDFQSLAVEITNLSTTNVRSFEIKNWTGTKAGNRISHQSFSKTNLDFWKEYLAEIEPCNFPLLSQEPGKKGRSTRTLNKQTIQLHAFSRMYGVSVENLFQIAWAMVLRCYTANDDVCFGYSASETDDSASVAIARLMLNNDRNMNEVLQQTKTDFLKSRENFAELTVVKHQLGLDDTGVFNTLLTYRAVSSLPERRIRDTATSKPYNVAVTAQVSKSVAEILFSYSTDTLTSVQVTHVIDTFDQILNDMISVDPRKHTIGSLDLMSPRSCRQIRDWNATMPPRVEKCADELIQQQALLHPRAEAICSWDKNFTYGQLEIVSSRLARFITALGVKPEVFVVLCFEKSAWAIVAQLAVLKAGGAFVSIDPSHPESRLKMLVDEIGADLVLCSSDLQPKMASLCKKAFAVSQKGVSQLPESPLALPGSRPSPSNAAYAIFTSGTTGKPKATVVEHIALSTTAIAMMDALHMNSGTRALQFSNYTFDVSVLEIMMTLMTGGCVCVPSEEERMNNLGGAIRRMEANYMSSPPAIVNTLEPKTVPTLKTIITGGEKMPAHHIDRWHDRFVINAYGPSEATVVATVGVKVDWDGNRVNDDPTSIGTAANCRVWIVDPNNYNRLLPVGAVGEMLLEGSNIAREYLGNPEKTKAAFVEDPVWSHHTGLHGIFKRSDRMYRTGDLVRYNSDGTLTFISRKDTQIKFNGQRIELEEIEHQCIRCLPNGSQVAVDVVVPGEKTVAKALAAFFTVHDGDLDQGGANDQFAPTVPGADALLLPISVSNMDAVQKLKTSLPDHLPQSMMPRLFFSLRNLPFTSSAKIDRRRLRAMVQNLSKNTLKSYITFNNGEQRSQVSDDGIESQLRMLWEKTLDLEDGSVTNEDSFFALGGDSFSAMNLVGAAQALGITLTVAAIFKAPVLLEMAKMCTSSTDVVATTEQKSLNPFSLLPSGVDLEGLIDELSDGCIVSKDAIIDAYPCSAVQEGLLTLSVKQNGAYVAQPAFRLADSTDLDRFKAAWEQTVADLDILRTRIMHTEAMNFAQVILKDDPISWVHAESFAGLPNDSIELPKYNGGRLTGYAIVQPPGSSARYFVWSVHHALYDGWSIPLVYRRFEENYKASSAKEPATSYGLFIEYLNNNNMAESDAFWTSYLADISSIPFPHNKKAVPDAVRAGNTQRHSIKVSRPANSVNYTIPVLLRAAWGIVVAAHTGSGDVCFGETLSGRNIDLPGVGDIAGPVLSTVPTRVQVDNEMTIVQYLERMNQSTTDMIPHLHAGLQRIRQLSSHTATGCNFQNLLVIQPTEGQLDDSIWTDEKRETSEDFFTHPLVLECGISKTEIVFTAHHDELVVNGWQTQRLIEQFGHVLKHLMSVPKTSNDKLSRVDISSAEDKGIIAEWNNRTPLAIEKCVHEFIREKCIETPNAPAVCAWDGELTYKELWDMASAFAKYLVSRGVGPEVFVPVCLDKSAWAMVTLVSILIAGGAYIPLDPHHPTSRHEEILADVGANMILCSPSYISRYTRVVKTVLAISKETLKAYGSLQSTVRAGAQVTPSNMAYALFTSGSTGRAKGIIVEHRNCVSSILAYAPVCYMDSTSRVFQFASLTFDAAILETLTVLMIGGCICVPSEDERLNDVSGAIRRMNVNWSFLTPAIASIIEPSSVPSIKYMAVGGELVAQEVITKWVNCVKLMIVYGPTETVVFATVDTEVTSHRDPARIGYGIPSTLTWIVDAEDHNKLAPLGAVGELALEGMCLAREYMNNPEKNAESFIENPTWGQKFKSHLAGPRRIYKTGDLCYYNTDGSIQYVSRKDHQVKVHGQRMELGEIEHRIVANTLVRHAVVILPKAGPLQKRLVTVMSLNKISADNKLISDKACELIDDDDFNKDGLADLVEVQKSLESQLPIYMVPQTWALIKKLPMLVSGKLDRKKITAWLESIDDDSYERIMQAYDAMKRGPTEKPQEQEEDSSLRIIREIFSQVLNISLSKVNVDRSFVSLGGDSITGMAVISRARKQGLCVTLNDILQSRSVKELAQAATAKDSAPSHREEKAGEGFGLSPVQKIYMNCSSSFKGAARFNQSITVRISRRVEGEVLRRAIKAVTSQHSMFRARFNKGKDGIWQQKAVAEVDDSYRFRVHSVNDTRAMVPKVADSQSCLDPINGPIFAADLFNLRTGGQVLFLVAHHLCVDMVSWRIILSDLEEMIVSGSLSDEKALSFQSWCVMQLERVKAHDMELALPFTPEPSDLSYWGMQDCSNVYGDIKMETFSLTEAATQFILDGCHSTFGTEPVDVLLACIINSFHQVFDDRKVPTIYNEGHGRESWDSRVDLSRTVGWFTTMAPLLIDGAQENIKNIIKRVKDTRRKIADNGRPYFAKSMLQAGSEDFQVPLEILFNYLGKLQQLEREDSLFLHQGSVFDSSDFAVAGDMGPQTVRFALFEVSAIVIKDRLNIAFTYNRNMQREGQIRRWILQCKQTLEKDVLQLKNATPEPTLSDYPLLPINYQGLQILTNNTFRKLGIRSKHEVEDIYPCSPMQEGLLLSQLRDPSAYIFHTVFEMKDARTDKVDAERLARSWRLLVDRHPVLRTVFIDSSYSGGSFDQLVLKKIPDNVLRVECADAQVQEKLDAISMRELNSMRQAKFSNQLTVCKTSSGRVVVKMEINHAIIDGGGVDVLLRDLTMAYDRRLPDSPGPCFSDYIKYIKTQSQVEALNHWKQYLSGVNPCHLSQTNASQSKRELKGILMDFNRYPELLKFCEKTSVTLANLTLSAWAIVLKQFTGSDDVCFGYLSAGRDAPVNGIQDMVGIFINMLCCRVQFSPKQTLTDISKRVNGDYVRSIPHQSCSLATIQHELGSQGQSLFNTTLSIQNHGASGTNKEKGLSFDLQHAHDPSEYAVTVNADISRGAEGIMLRYWNDMVSDEQAQSLVDTIAKVFTGFIEGPNMTIASSNFNVVKTPGAGWDNPQATFQEKMRSNADSLDGAAIQKIIDDRVHEIIGQMLREGKLMVPQFQTSGLSSYGNTDDGIDSPYPLEGAQGADDSGVCSATSRCSEEGMLSADVERRLWNLWSTALGLSPNVVRYQDSFFKLGGDSITAMKMVSAAREDGLVLTVADVFNNPVFEDMLATVRASNATQQILDADLQPAHKEVESFSDSKPTTLAPTPSSESITVLRPTKPVDDASVQSGICPKIGVFKGGIADVLPVTDFQAMSLTATLFQSRWMLNYFFLEGSGPLDLRRLRESCLKVVDAFDILRTVFVCFHDQFFQVVLRKIRPSIFVYETDKGLDEFTSTLQQRDREHGPREGEQYVQFYVVKKKGSDLHRIMIRLSHTQYDGVCLSKIMSAIKLGYEGSPLPPVTPYAGYLRQLPGTIGPDHYDHWTNLLKGSQMTQVIRRKGTSMFQNIGAFTEIRKTIEVPPTALGNVTVATVMQAAWALTLAKLSAQQDVVFGLTISGRNATVPGIENTVGPCVNVIPVRVKFDENWTGLELFRYLQDQQVSNMPYESVGFREIIKQCTDWPAWTYFTTAVFHQNVDYEGSLELDTTKYRMGGAGVNDNFADLTMVSRPADEHNLTVTLGYSEKGPVLPDFAEKVLDMVCETAQSLIANPSTALPSPSMLVSLPPQVIDDLPRTTDEHFLSAHLKSRSIAELLVHSDILSRSWNQVLPPRDSTKTVDSDAAEKPSNQAAFQLDASFFDLGGDIFNMAQLTWLLEQEGLKVRLEDLLEHPSFLGQMAVLALHNAKHQEDFPADFATGAVSPDPSVRTRSEKKKTWEKAMSLARKLTRRNGNGNSNGNGSIVSSKA
ncbi:AMP-dependent synthetase/ligase [Penicillium malachiteum]|uniref:AMP-dependent synthetase/ligase n=1 Tax=Penicillium malachiteum TaxID=1324776 RepID=UPI002547B180|nr:AMP-dependent synthetase/ligase [Penicillium malachiteum]KAJ5714059.1 AMP-dependent synthetase/ligase [Penicillium malachiteum]